jgi:hypothetical protein
MKSVLRLAAITLFGALTGCATVPDAGIKSEAALPAGHGLVVVQVVNNAHQISDAISTWSEVVVVDRERKDEDGKPLVTSIPALTDGLSSTRVFVGSLPPGRYRFGGLYAFKQYAGGNAYYATAPAPQLIGDFEVGAGRLTSLGTVLFQPLYGDPLASKLLFEPSKTAFAMSRIADDEALDEFVALRYPRLAEEVRAAPRLGWVADEYGELRAQLEQATRSYALLDRPQGVTTDGSLVFGGRLGTLHRRSGAGTWTHVHVGGNRELLAYGNSGTSHYAGGERGRICRAARFEGPWQCDYLPARDQSVVWIGAAVPGAVHVVADERGRRRLYRGATDGTPNWTLVHEFGQPQNIYPPTSTEIKAQAPALWLDRASLHVTDLAKSYVVDLVTGNVGNGTVPPLFELIEQPNGVLVASPYSGWSGAKPPIASRDRGRTWQPMERLGVYGVLPYVLASGDMLAANNAETFVWVGWKKRENVAVLRAAPTSKDDRTVGHLPYGCHELLNSVSRDDALVARCFDGSLLTSTDEGRTWKTEYARAVRAAALPDAFKVSSAVSPASGSQ